MIFLGTEKFIADILEEHLETLQTLWAQRSDVLIAPGIFPRTVENIEERILAHTDGLVLAAEAARPLLEEGLAADEPALASAAAFALIRMESFDGLQPVMKALQQAQGGCLEALCRALSHGPKERALPEIVKLMNGASPALTLALIQILASHGKLENAGQRLEPFLTNPDAAIRRHAWRIVAFGATLPQERFTIGIDDREKSVSNEALHATAWNRQQWLVDFCSRLAKTPKPEHTEAYRMLAVLAGPPFLPILQSLGQAAALGPSRFRLLGAYGHPQVVDMIIEGIGSPDVATAVAAAEAFEKITGFEIASNERTTVPPADGHVPDDFEKEFLEEVRIPDLEKARSHWQKVRAKYSEGTRWCGGHNVSSFPPPAILKQLDMQSRWEAYFRGNFHGSWNGNPFELEAFPQAR